MMTEVENNNEIAMMENNKVAHVAVDLEEGRHCPTAGDSKKPVSSSRVRISSSVLRRVAVMSLILGIGVCLIALLVVITGWLNTLQLFIVAVLATFLARGGYHWLYVAIMTAPRDIKAIWAYIKMLWQVRYFNNNRMILPEIFDGWVAKHPDKTCFLFLDEVWSFSKVQEYSLKIANVFKAHGYRKGQAVALIAPNCPQYVAICLGLARLGVIVPLINHNQRSKALLHSITVGKCDAVIYAEEFEQAVKEISGELSPSVSLYQWSPASGTAKEVPVIHTDSAVKDLTSLVASASADPVQLPSDKSFHDSVLYIYTSGTTGLPKAAVITHSRYFFMCGGIHHLSRLNDKDIVYTSLPLYHTAGFVTACGQAVIYGNTVAIRSKFSASNFIKDCIKYNATIANYIGEMCRYLLAVPESPIDKQHKLKLMYGNGLRPQIWKQFTDRFNIPKITEFYGATEGNANIVNIDGKIGAIGFVSRILPLVYPIALIKVDEHTGEPIRNAKGLCQQCKPNEPGVFIGKIQANNPTRQFLGYVDKGASEKKIVRDVFSHGDSAFISGDILISDDFGYLYFKDRTGDTFRWRGENVSTSEVEALVSQHADQKDAVVYGVLVPNAEGRAGMCSIADPNGTLDLGKLTTGLQKDLPPYARPIFLRLLKQLDMTGTFKMKKTDLQNDGYNPNVLKDKLYYLDQKTAQYIPLTPEVYANIQSGQIRL